jgi:transcriptional regulator of arginine metabolism
MISKHARQQAILRLVRDHPVSTQGGLVHHLESEGIAVNQSTISRDIKDLGLVKTPRPDGGYCYSVPTNVVALTERSLRILREFATAVDGSGQLAVIHTDSGNAHPVGEAIDRLGIDDVVGTVAGDNTLLVILQEGTHWQQFRDELEDLLR